VTTSLEVFRFVVEHEVGRSSFVLVGTASRYPARASRSTPRKKRESEASARREMSEFVDSRICGSELRTGPHGGDDSRYCCAMLEEGTKPHIVEYHDPRT